MEKGLFKDSGIPTPEIFLKKLSQLHHLIQKERDSGKERTKNSSKPFVDGNIVYLPKKGKAFFVGDLHGDFEAVVSIIVQTKFLESM